MSCQAQEWLRGITWWRVLRITLTPAASTFACITNSKLKAAVVLEWRFSSASSQLAFPVLHLLLFEEAASWKQLYGSSLTGMFSCHCWSKFVTSEQYGYDTSLCFHSKHCAIIFVLFLSSIMKKPKVSGYKSPKADHFTGKWSNFIQDD